MLLKFGNGNGKLAQGIITFSLPAGWTCPFARKCLAKTNAFTGRISDGAKTEFRCFAASDEQIRPTVRRARWHNYELLKDLSREGMTSLILASLSRFAGYVRIHVAGDYFSLDYFDAWLEVARQRRRTLFYGYTKALPFWVKRFDDLPENLVLTASLGGTHDHLIENHRLRSARVVLSKREADSLGLELDHDDSHAMEPGPDFALLIHGVQPAGSAASRAVTELRKQGEFGYGAKADEERGRRHQLDLVHRQAAADANQAVIDFPFNNF